MATLPAEARYGARLGYRGARGGRKGLDMESGAQRGVSIVNIVGMSTPHGTMLWRLIAGDVPGSTSLYPHYGPERKGCPYLHLIGRVKLSERSETCSKSQNKSMPTVEPGMV